MLITKDQLSRVQIMKKIFLIAAVALMNLSLIACESSGPRYQNVRSYSEGLAPAQASNKRWGYVNGSQQWIIRPRFEDALEFKDGKLLFVKMGVGGFINKRGEWL